MLHSMKDSSDLLADGAFTILEAVAWSRLSRSALYEAMHQGELQYIKVGKRRLIPRRGLQEYLTSRLEGGDR